MLLLVSCLTQPSLVMRMEGGTLCEFVGPHDCPPSTEILPGLTYEKLSLAANGDPVDIPGDANSAAITGR